MHVIYFFLILSIINIAMFLLLTQCLAFYSKKSEFIRGLIIISSSIIFTIISALAYSGMIGWDTKENYDWNINNGLFKVSPKREKCMKEQVCEDSKNVTKNFPGILTGKCNKQQKIPFNTLNFPPNRSKDCIVNPDCKDENYGSGCHKWTVGWNGNKNFPMTYANWIDNSNSEYPENWSRPDATSNSISYIPPTASCRKNHRNVNPNNINYSLPWDSYSTLGNYADSTLWFPNLPNPGGSINEFYTPNFLNCSKRLRKK